MFDTRDPVLRVKRSGVPIGDFEPITQADYQPSGGTPLRDAVGRFIGHLDGRKGEGVVTIGLLLDESGSMGGQRDAVIESSNKFVQGMRDVDAIDPDADGNVICVVVTDGYENASKELTHEAVQKLIADREGTDEWTFIFLGAAIDAWSQGQSLGLSGGATGQTVSYSGTEQGTYAVMDSVTSDTSALLQNVSAYRSSRVGSTQRSVSDTGAESTSNMNAPQGKSAPVEYGNMDWALKAASDSLKKGKKT